MRLRAALLLPLLAGASGCSLEPPAATPPPAVALPPRPAAWKWANEERWMIAQVAQSIAALSVLARHPARVGSEDWQVQVIDVDTPQGSGASLQPLKARLAIGPRRQEYSLAANDYLLSPRSWAPLARQLGAGAATTAAGGALLKDDDFLENLLDLRADVIEKENQRISEALELDPLSAAANEQAALLLGAFSLREAAGGLSDVRPALARSAAHLAIARAQRGDAPYGLAGRYAELTLLALVGRQRDAYDGVLAREQEAPSASERAWLRALRLRITGDWRAMPSPQGASLLERLERFRARRIRLSLDRTNPELRTERLEPVADWARLTLYGERNVEACAVFGSSLVNLNLAEAQGVLALGREAPPSSVAEFVTLVKDAPAPQVVAVANDRASIRVIDRGLWDRFFERHLVHAVEQEYNCLRWTYGMVDAPPEYASQARARFGALPSLRLVARGLVRDARDPDRGYREAIGLVEREPERVTAAAWTALRADKNYPRLLSSLPDESLWFTTGFLRGTTYDADERLHRMKTLRVVTLENKAGFRALAPWDYWVVWSYIWKLGEQQPTFELVKREAADLLQYDARLLRSITLTWPKYLPIYKPAGLQLCELDPGEWGNYGYGLAALGDEEGALEAFRTMLVRMDDEVAISNSLQWLIDYEYAHGRKDEAMRLARRGAATGSGSGLWSLGRMLELRGDLKGAFAQMRQIQERYNERIDMVTMYLRHRKEFAGTDVERHVLPVVNEIFPTGLEAASVDTLHGAPADGVLIQETSERLGAIGLKPGAILVAMNNVRVRSVEQYHCLRWASEAPAIDYIAWQGGVYTTAHSDYTNRRLDVQIDSYVAKPAS